jgi:hypothetical protein
MNKSITQLLSLSAIFYLLDKKYHTSGICAEYNFGF